MVLRVRNDKVTRKKIGMFGRMSCRSVNSGMITLMISRNAWIRSLSGTDQTLGWSPSQRRRVGSTFFDHFLLLNKIEGRLLLVNREPLRDDFGLGKLLSVGMPASEDTANGVIEDIDAWLRWCPTFSGLTFFTGMGSSSISIAVTVV